MQKRKRNQNYADNFIVLCSFALHKKRIFIFEEIIFLFERCIVEKKTYLCGVGSEKWPDI